MIHKKNFPRRGQVARQAERAHFMDIRRSRRAKSGKPMTPEAIGCDGGDVTTDPVATTDEPVATGLPDMAQVTAASEPVRAVTATRFAKSQPEGIDQVALMNRLENALPKAGADPPLLLVKPVERTAPKQIQAAKPGAAGMATEPEAQEDACAFTAAGTPGVPAVCRARPPDLAGGSRPPAPGGADDLPPPVVVKTAAAVPVEPRSVDDAPASACMARRDDQAQAVATEPWSGPWSGPSPLTPARRAVSAGSVILTEAIPAIPDTDLCSLPGVGPGLLWMLQQCGIHALEDLARSEAAVLSLRLGPVGQILTVDIWLDHARKSRVGQR